MSIKEHGNKGKIPWNKGKTGLQVAWNKGLTKDTDIRVYKYSKKRKKFPKLTKIDKLLTRKMIEKDRENKYRCCLCNISFTKKGILNHYFYFHTEEGIKKREKISKILKGRIPPNKYSYDLLKKKYPNFFKDHDIKKYRLFIKIRCTECRNWFIPERSQVSEKIRQINFGTGTRFLFCSEKCKDNSFLYRMKKDPSLLKKYKKYYRKVEIITRKSIKEHSEKIKNFHLRSYDYHLDHKCSIREGFEYNVAPEIIGHWKNLQIIPKFENESKGSKSSITIYELKELIND